MKVKVENIHIQMTTNEASMLCSVLEDVDWKKFHPDSSVVKSYQEFVKGFISMIGKVNHL